MLKEAGAERIQAVLPLSSHRLRLTHSKRRWVNKLRLSPKGNREGAGRTSTELAKEMGDRNDLRYAQPVALQLASRAFGILEIDRAGVNPLNNAQHFRTRARCDEKATVTTIGFNQLWMMWIGFKDRELRGRTGRIRHPAQSTVAGELMLIFSCQFSPAAICCWIPAM
jgi:hypothetical protein